MPIDTTDRQVKFVKIESSDPRGSPPLGVAIVGLATPPIRIVPQPLRAHRRLETTSLDRVELEWSCLERLTLEINDELVDALWD